MTATLLITRDSGFADFARRYTVVIDGTDVGLIKNGGSFECPVSDGRHMLQLTVDWCSSGVVEFEIAAGERLHFECGSILRGWKLFRAGKVMRETPHEWIWLKPSPNKPMPAPHDDARA